jgi:hypothetical protein
MDSTAEFKLARAELVATPVSVDMLITNKATVCNVVLPHYNPAYRSDRAEFPFPLEAFVAVHACSDNHVPRGLCMIARLGSLPRHCQAEPVLWMA